MDELHKLKNQVQALKIENHMLKNKKFVHLCLDSEEIEDLLSMADMGREVAKDRHKDSPEFVNSLHDLYNKLWAEYQRQTKP